MIISGEQIVQNLIGFTTSQVLILDSGWSLTHTVTYKRFMDELLVVNSFIVERLNKTYYSSWGTMAEALKAWDEQTRA